jgi:SAM-dependent methyltransferase
MLARAGPVLARIPRGAPFRIVEVGVNRGQLAEHLLRERPQLTWHGVDPWWDAAEHSSDAYRRTADGHATQPLEVSERCLRETRTRMAPYGDRACIIREASPGAAQRFANASADAVFLDGAHDYEAVRQDIEAWWRVVKPGGWLGGDDYRHPDPRFDFSGVDRAVDEFAVWVGAPVEFDESDVPDVVVGSCWFVSKRA